MHTLSKFWAFVVLTIALALTAVPNFAQSPTTSPQAALSALIAGPNSPLPAGTQLYSVQVENGLATANFSRELRDNFHGGDTEDANAVNSILRTLGAAPSISRVQILVAGHPVDSLGGMIVISRPLAVIRPVGYDEAHHRYLHRRLSQSHA